MSVLSTAQTIPQVIGEVVVIPTYSSLEATLKGVVKELDENYGLQSEAVSIKELLVKYGILDLTFQNKKTQQFLKIYCEVADTGYFPQLQKAGKQFDLDEMRDYMRGYLQDTESLFPIKATIIDCCIANDQGIWTEKHFYS